MIQWSSNFLSKGKRINDGDRSQVLVFMREAFDKKMEFVALAAAK